MAQTSIERASRCRLAVGAELVGQLQEYKEKAWHGHQRSFQQPREVKSLEDPERPQVPGLEDVLKSLKRGRSLEAQSSRRMPGAFEARAALFTQVSK